MISKFQFNSDRPLTIVAPGNKECPIYFQKPNIIFLSTSGSSYYCQVVFQLSHEMCHYFINTGIQNPDLKWFEESLCECSSLFFLTQMSLLWEQSNQPFKNSYSYEYINYRIDREKIHKEFNISSSTSYDCYDRDKNTFIALKLLPIFQKNESLWSDVPRLSEIEAETIYELLDKWSSICKEENIYSALKIRDFFTD